LVDPDALEAGLASDAAGDADGPAGSAVVAPPSLAASPLEDAAAGSELAFAADSPFPAVAPTAARAVERASFLAQPLPLKWMAGADICLRIGPPHTSHVVGPVALMPWRTSMVRPQDVQA
jgi:hypothetical protein